MGKKRVEKCTILEIFIELLHIALESYKYLKISNFHVFSYRLRQKKNF